MKKTLRLLLGLMAVVLTAAAFAQNTQPVRHKIAIFAPLYLDSAFEANGAYKYGKAFPKFVNPGLEFYMGAQTALDSLKKAGAPLEVFIYDTKSVKTSIGQRLASAELKGLELMIAHASAPEVRQLAEDAQQRKIPLVSATLPNDAGITANPYLVVLNSTLRAHCEGIYRYLQRYHNMDRIIVFQKNGTQEDEIKQHLQELVQTTTSPRLKIEFKNIGTTFDDATMASNLDSLRNTVCIAGSLDQNFGIRMAQALAMIRETYPVTIIGMPTWDGLGEFRKAAYKDIEIMYSTPFYYARTNSLGTKLATDFETQTSGRPSDMFFRGYETTLRFALLLLDTNKDMASNLSRKGNYIFTNFDIQPVFLNKQNMTLDYFENKKLYFVKTFNGQVTVQ